MGNRDEGGAGTNAESPTGPETRATPPEQEPVAVEDVSEGKKEEKEEGKQQEPPKPKPKPKKEKEDLPKGNSLAEIAQRIFAQGKELATQIKDWWNEANEDSKNKTAFKNVDDPTAKKPTPTPNASDNNAARNPPTRPQQEEIEMADLNAAQHAAAADAAAADLNAAQHAAAADAAAADLNVAQHAAAADAAAADLNAADAATAAAQRQTLPADAEGLPDPPRPEEDDDKLLDDEDVNDEYDDELEGGAQQDEDEVETAGEDIGPQGPPQ